MSADLPSPWKRSQAACNSARICEILAGETWNVFTAVLVRSPALRTFAIPAE